MIEICYCFLKKAVGRLCSKHSNHITKPTRLPINQGLIDRFSIIMDVRIFNECQSVCGDIVKGYYRKVLK